MFKKITPFTWRKSIPFWMGSILLLALLDYVAGDKIPENILEGVMLIVIFLLIVSGVAFWRCPKCRNVLPTKSMTTIEYCPWCGERLK